MLNKIMLIGRIGQDPAIKYLPDGNPVVNFSLATDERYKNKAGEQVQKTEWFNVIAYRKLAEIIAQFCTKGKLLYIEGKVQTRNYEKDGVKHYVTEVIADQMKMLDSKKDSGGSSENTGREKADGGGAPEEQDVPF